MENENGKEQFIFKQQQKLISIRSYYIVVEITMRHDAFV